jgi:hypothetical protein
MILRIHTSKKEGKEYKKERSRYSDIFLKTEGLTPLRQHKKFSFSKNDAFKKEIVPYE